MFVVPEHTEGGPVIEHVGLAYTVTPFVQVLVQPVVILETVRLKV
jgi:hypothetical protein